MSTTNIVLLVFIIVLLGLLSFVIYLLSKNKNRNQQVNLLDQDVFEKEFDNIKKSLHEMNAINKENANRSERELRNITKVMTDKKSRGRYGERILETILQDAYGDQPKIVKTQYKIKNLLVDIGLDVEGQGVIPIDSKFPMEYYLEIEKSQNDWQKKQSLRNFEEQIKKHIGKVKEYINIPQTTPYAMIFIPAESVFAEIQSHQGILDFSSKNKVYFVSPTTLLATITAASNIKYQNNQLRNLPKIIKNLDILNKHFLTYQNSWFEVQKHINRAGEQVLTHERSVKNIINKTEEILKSSDAKKLLEERNE